MGFSYGFMLTFQEVSRPILGCRLVLSWKSELMVYSVVLRFMWCLASGYAQLKKDIGGICEHIVTCEVIDGCSGFFEKEED
ncbi:hypothetical protein [Galliscardovia ingluviei]|uniref:hypothetical protein n=1 Tax=Galliscardovia ingluviei TaxID=1769422 RepID=UPI001662B3E8|nr:hypothetical protein [Galliscardovia ingluviei]